MVPLTNCDLRPFNYSSALWCVRNSTFECSGVKIFNKKSDSVIWFSNSLSGSGANPQVKKILQRLTNSRAICLICEQFLYLLSAGRKNIIANRDEVRKLPDQSLVEVVSPRFCPHLQNFNIYNRSQYRIYFC